MNGVVDGGATVAVTVAVPPFSASMVDENRSDTVCACATSTTPGAKTVSKARKRETAGATAGRTRRNIISPILVEGKIDRRPGPIVRQQTPSPRSPRPVRGTSQRCGKRCTRRNDATGRVSGAQAFGTAPPEAQGPEARKSARPRIADELPSGRAGSLGAFQRRRRGEGVSGWARRPRAAVPVRLSAFGSLSCYAERFTTGHAHRQTPLAQPFPATPRYERTESRDSAPTSPTPNTMSNRISQI